MLIYLCSLPVWNLILPSYAYWHFDDFSWGDTRLAAGETKGAGKGGHDEGEGEFDSSKITMKRWGDFEQERRLRAPTWSAGQVSSSYGSQAPQSQAVFGSEYNKSVRISPSRRGHERKSSHLAYEEHYTDDL